MKTVPTFAVSTLASLLLKLLPNVSFVYSPFLCTANPIQVREVVGRYPRGICAAIEVGVDAMKVQSFLGCLTRECLSFLSLIKPSTELFFPGRIEQIIFIQ